MKSLAFARGCVLGALCLVLALSFSQGLWAALGVSIGLPKAFVEVGSAGLFLFALFSRGLRPALAPLKLIAPLVLLAVLGSVPHLFGSEFHPVAAVLFARKALSLSLLFVAAFLLDFSAAEKRALFLTLFILVLAQIPVVGVKSLTIGVDEKHWIGTLSQNAGQLGLLFPLFCLSFLIPFYLDRGGWGLPVLIGLFSLWGVLNEKRAVIFCIPLFLSMGGGLYFLEAKLAAFARRAGGKGRPFLPLKVFAFRFFVALAIGGLTFASGVKLIPSFSLVDNKPVAVHEAILYSKDYLLRTYNDPMNMSDQSVAQNKNIQLGRVAMILEAVRLIRGQSASTLFFGYGGGIVSDSPWLGEGRRDRFFKAFGLRGTFPYALELLFDAGLAGLLLFASFFGIIGWFLFRRLLALPFRSEAFLFVQAALLMHAAMAFDCWAYSTVAWTSDILSPTYFLFLAFALGPSTPLPEGTLAACRRLLLRRNGR